MNALTHKVRYLSGPQIAETWWSASDSGRRQARARLLQLVKMGLIERRAILAHPMLPLAEAVSEWSPGANAPDFERVAYRLQSRWKEPERQQTIYFATKAATKRFGGAAEGLVHAYQITHDLHVSAMYLRLLETSAELALRWTPEALLAPLLPRFSKIPDAAFVESSGRITRILEFGGRYDARRVGKFHEFCAKQNYAYELW